MKRATQSPDSQTHCMHVRVYVCETALDIIIYPHVSVLATWILVMFESSTCIHMTLCILQDYHHFTTRCYRFKADHVVGSICSAGGW